MRQTVYSISSEMTAQDYRSNNVLSTSQIMNKKIFSTLLSSWSDTQSFFKAEKFLIDANLQPPAAALHIFVNIRVLNPGRLAVTIL